MAETYDKKVDGVFPIIISKDILLKKQKVGEVGSKGSKKLWNMWNSKFNPKIVLKESFSHLGLGKIEHADVILDIKESHLWRKIRGEFYFYNALWTLTGDGFVEDFKYLLPENRTLKWKIVYFSDKQETPEKAGRAKKRKKRMYDSLKKILNSGDTLKSKSIHIREADENDKFPNITFFLFKDENENGCLEFIFTN